MTLTEDEKALAIEAVHRAQELHKINLAELPALLRPLGVEVITS